MHQPQLVEMLQYHQCMPQLLQCSGLGYGSPNQQAFLMPSVGRAARRGARPRHGGREWRPRAAARTAQSIVPPPCVPFVDADHGQHPTELRVDPSATHLVPAHDVRVDRRRRAWGLQVEA